VRHYHGGLADWTDAGLPLETVTPAAPSLQINGIPLPARGERFVPPHTSVRAQLGSAVLDLVDLLSTAQLFAVWLGLVLLSGSAYWLIELGGGAGLVEGNSRVAASFSGLLTAIYFSFITATSVGYGDVLPVGATRIIAVTEAVGGLLIFGLLIAKFVSFRQDMLVREIHGVTFDERLARIQTNLHLVVSELLAFTAMCDDGSVRVERLGPRLETTTLVFASELRTIHRLLYNPQQAPDEPVLGVILANLASALKMLHEVLPCLPDNLRQSPGLADGLRTLATLSQDICADCVPQVYAPALTVWMDRIQEVARTIA
jgi:hypothetical protein